MGTPKCKVHQWPEELKQLRRIVLECGLNEESKWGVPCYTWQKKNVLIVSAFREYCALSFFKGALLNDSDNLLQKPGEHTQSARLIKFTNVDDIVRLKTVLKAYIFEAIEVEKADLKVETKKNTNLQIPEELQRKLDELPIFKTAFEALTPGRQKGYIYYFSQPKQTSTRASRIEKCIPRILEGKGFNDR